MRALLVLVPDVIFDLKAALHIDFAEKKGALRGKNGTGLRDASRGFSAH